MRNIIVLLSFIITSSVIYAISVPQQALALDPPGIRGEVGVAKKAVDGGTYSTGTKQYLDCRYPDNTGASDMDAIWVKVTDNIADIVCKKGNGDTSPALRLTCESSGANPAVFTFSNYGERGDEVALFECQVTPDPFD